MQRAPHPGVTQHREGGGRQLHQSEQPCGQFVAHASPSEGQSTPSPATGSPAVPGGGGFQESQRNSFLAPLLSWRPCRKVPCLALGAPDSAVQLDRVQAWPASSPRDQVNPGGVLALSCCTHCLPHSAPKCIWGQFCLGLVLSAPLPGGLPRHPTSPFLPAPDYAPCPPSRRPHPRTGPHQSTRLSAMTCSWWLRAAVSIGCGGVHGPEAFPRPFVFLHGPNPPADKRLP